MNKKQRHLMRRMIRAMAHYQSLGQWPDEVFCSDTGGLLLDVWSSKLENAWHVLERELGHREAGRHHQEMLNAEFIEALDQEASRYHQENLMDGLKVGSV